MTGERDTIGDELPVANEETGKFRQQEEELANLQRKTQITEVRVKLAEAESSLAKLRQPWWRSGLTVTALAAMVTAVVPLTAQIQSWKDQAIKAKELNFELRDKYLNAVIRDPRQEKRVLGFIVDTADDSKSIRWAEKELKKATEAVDALDATVVERKRLYRETIGVVAQLADGGISEAEWEAQRVRFWRLYRTDLLPVESLEVETLMVKIGRELEKCRPGACKAIEDLTYQLARQMKAEIAADASSAMASKKIPRQSDGPVVQDQP